MPILQTSLEALKQLKIVYACIRKTMESFGSTWRIRLAEIRRSSPLTVSFICTVANYEYGFYWHFYQIVEVNVKVEESGEDNVHNNAFYTEETLLNTESQAMHDCNQLSAPHWIIRNTRTVIRTGQLTGYKLVPCSNCLPLAGSESKFLRRAEFVKHNLWVTPYALDENFPGGEFPNQNPRVGEGLALWVKQNRSLQESDIVLRYVFGITHVPRLEDWSVMPVEHIGFMLQPHGFFNCSPAVDAPPGACESDAEDTEPKETAAPKSVSNGLIAKL